MTKLSLHGASAPMFDIMLTNLSAWLDKAEAHAAAKKIDVDVLLSSRIVADMLPLRAQIHVATAFAKNAVCRLAGETPPDYADTDVTLEQLRARIARTLDLVRSADAAAIDARENQDITFGVGGENKMTLSGTDYLLRFALPNFYFHIITAYDILRQNGVELGKADFLRGAVELPA